MDFVEAIRDVSTRSKTALKEALTEEATKTSVILPLIKAFGFDVFSLSEVVPEYISDVGTKKGEKVDFALKIGGKIAMLLEVKPIFANLGSSQYNQLYRYFSVTEARLAILTNGREMWFFADVEEPNKMDRKPFFTVDLHALDDREILQLAKFQKHNFNIDTIVETASNLKYTSAAAIYLRTQLDDPDDDFTKLVGRHIHDGSLTKAVMEQLKPAIMAALDTIVKDRIQDKLGVAFRSQTPSTEPPASASVELEGQESETETTEEELQAFYIVRAIAARIIDIARVTIRDSKTYCSIFIDDNNRKPVCRFYFNGKSVKYFGTFDSQKNETKHQISDASEIYKFSANIEEAIKPHLT